MATSVPGLACKWYTALSSSGHARVGTSSLRHGSTAFPHSSRLLPYSVSLRSARCGLRCRSGLRAARYDAIRIAMYSGRDTALVRRVAMYIRYERYVVCGTLYINALLKRVLEHSARRVPSGCASGARRGAFCSVSAEQNAYAERAITKQNGSKCNPHGERRAERFRAGVKIQSAWQVPSRTRTRCACGARPGAFCSASAERMEKIRN